MSRWRRKTAQLFGMHVLCSSRHDSRHHNFFFRKPCTFLQPRLHLHCRGCPEALIRSYSLCVSLCQAAVFSCGAPVRASCMYLLNSIKSPSAPTSIASTCEILGCIRLCVVRSVGMEHVDRKRCTEFLSKILFAPRRERTALFGKLQWFRPWDINAWMFPPRPHFLFSKPLPSNCSERLGILQSPQRGESGRRMSS